MGGLTIDAGYGLVSPLWVGALLASLGLLSLLPFWQGTGKGRRSKGQHAGIRKNNVADYAEQ
jgi:hypothetical protein